MAIRMYEGRPGLGMSLELFGDGQAVSPRTAPLVAGFSLPRVQGSEGNVTSNTFRTAPRGARPAKSNPFVTYVAGDRDSGYVGGVIHEETGEEVARTREAWTASHHLETTLEHIANVHWLRWLQSSNQLVPAWLAMKTALYGRSYVAGRCA